MTYFWAILVVSLLGLLFIGLAFLNHKTKKPEGCENPSFDGCAGCTMLTCGNFKKSITHDKLKDENNEIVIDDKESSDKELTIKNEVVAKEKKNDDDKKTDEKISPKEEN